MGNRAALNGRCRGGGFAATLRAVETAAVIVAVFLIEVKIPVADRPDVMSDFAAVLLIEIWGRMDEVVVIDGTDIEDTGPEAACALAGRIRFVAAEEFEFLLADDFASVLEFKRAIGAPGTKQEKSRQVRDQVNWQYECRLH